jgi:hypothetical protein
MQDSQAMAGAPGDDGRLDRGAAAGMLEKGGA